MDSAQIFGKVLRAARLERKMSQEKLALSAEVERNFISLIERGLSQPTLRILFRLATALEMPAWKLVKQVEDYGLPSESGGANPADGKC